MCGLSAEAAAPEDDSLEGGDELRTTLDWEAEDALKTAAFWAFAMAQLSQSLTGTAFWFHLKEVFAEAGLSEQVRQAMYPFLAVSGVLGRVVSGYIADRVEARWIVFAGLVASAVSLSLVPYMGQPVPGHPGGGGNALVFIVGVLQTVGSAFQATAGNVVYANNFGRKNLGTIQTVASSCSVLGSAFGPFPWGLIRDLTGSYTLAFRIGALLPVACAIAILSKGRRPRMSRSLRLGSRGGGGGGSRSKRAWEEQRLCTQEGSKTGAAAGL